MISTTIQKKLFDFTRVPFWRVLLLGIIYWFVIVDLIRKMHSGSISLLIVSDLLSLFLFILFYSSPRKINHVLRIMPESFKFLLLLFLCIVVFQSLNPSVPKFIIRLAGLRSYLLYVPAIGLGMYLMKTDKEINSIYRCLLTLTLPLIAISLYQALQGPNNLSDVMLSMDHQVHSYGQYNYALVSSTFASSRRFGRFLFLIYPIVYSIALYKHKSVLYRIVLTALFIAAVIISGSREVLVLYLLFHGMLLILRTRHHFTRIIMCIIVVMFGIMLWITVLNFSHSEITKKNYRLKAILSSQEDWRFRFRIYVVKPFVELEKDYSDSDTSEWLLGSGVGTYGQETRIIGNSDNSELMSLRQSRGDSGITKLIAELGLFGAVYFVLMWGFILFDLWRIVWRLRKQAIYPLALGLMFIPIGWLILLVKAHTTLSDGMMSFGLWMSLGVLLSIGSNSKYGHNSFP